MDFADQVNTMSGLITAVFIVLTGNIDTVVIVLVIFYAGGWAQDQAKNKFFI